MSNKGGSTLFLHLNELNSGLSPFHLLTLKRIFILPLVYSRHLLKGTKTSCSKVLETVCADPITNKHYKG